MQTRELAKIVGQAIFYASIQASWGGVEMSSKFSVMNFAKDQETLQRAADALRSYIIIGVVWGLGTALALWAEHGQCGLWAAIAANIVLMAWIVLSYIKAFRFAAEQYNLVMPKIF